MNTKRTTLILLFSLAVCCSFADNWLLLHTKSGSRQFFQIPGKMTIRTDGESLCLSSDKLQTVYFPLTLVDGYSFVDDKDVELSVDEILTDAIRITLIDNTKVVVEGLTDPSLIRIYGINGVEYPISATSNGTSTIINLTALPKGVLIINISGLASIKVNH